MMKKIFKYGRYLSSIYYVLLLILIGTISSLNNNGDYLELVVFIEILVTIIISTSNILQANKLFKGIDFEKLISNFVISVRLLFASLNVLYI